MTRGKYQADRKIRPAKENVMSSIKKLELVVGNLEKVFRTLGFEEQYETKDVVESINLANEMIDSGQSAKKKIQSLLQHPHAGLTKKLFAIKGTDTGTVSQHIPPKHVLKIKKDKKVTWDQEHLNFLFGDLEVSEYITTKYSVTEKNYNNASLIVKDKLDGGRTVIANDPSFTIEER